MARKARLSGPVDALPALCLRCRAIFPSAYRVPIRAIDCAAGPCPHCGGIGAVPSGAFNFDAREQRIYLVEALPSTDPGLLLRSGIAFNEDWAVVRDVGLEDQVLFEYVAEVHDQTLFAGFAYERLLALKRGRFHIEPREHSLRTFEAVGALLHSCAVVSNLLWVDADDAASLEETRAAARAEQLRRTLGIQTSALRDKRFRNHFEHIDYRLDKFLERNIRHAAKEGKPRRIVDMNTGGPPPVWARTHQIFRHFDFDTGRVHVGGEILELEPVLASLLDVQRRAGAWRVSFLENPRARALIGAVVSGQEVPDGSRLGAALPSSADA